MSSSATNDQNATNCTRSLLLSLPPELCVMICGHLEHDRQTLKVLRQTCKVFDDIASPIILKTVRLKMNLEDWGVLNKVADHPMRSKCVKTILCEMGMLPKMSDRESCRRVVLAAHLGSEPVDAEQLQSHYKEFNSRLQAEQDLLLKFILPSQESPEFQFKLSQLAELQSIESLDGVNPTRSLHTSLSREEQHTGIIPRSWRYDNTYITLLLEPLELSQVHLTSLKLTHYPESLLDRHVTELRGSVRHLQHLDLSFQGHYDWDQGGEMARSDSIRFTEWLGVMTELETFKLKQLPNGYNFWLGLIRTLNDHDKTWPKLKTLCLTGTFDKVHDIIEFFRRHHSLRRLYILNGHPKKPGPWIELIKQLPKLLTLEHFTFERNDFDYMLPPGLCNSLFNTFDFGIREKMKPAMNEELAYIGRHGRSSGDAERISALGTYYPQFVCKESNGTNEDRIRIAALGPESDLI